MVEMISAVTRFSDHIDLVRPYLLRVSRAHQPYQLGRQDLNDFKRAFIDTIAIADQ